MTLYVSSVTVDEVIDALRAFILPITAPAEVVRGQVNRVPLPSAPCVVLTELMTSDLSTPGMDYQPTDGTATITGPTRIDVQIDFYGQSAGDFCKAVKTAFRSQWGYSQFPDGIKPLYTSDGMQAPLTTGEQQYESRWTLTASMQYNPAITVAQEFADSLSANPVNAADQ